jgi:hypothetical protein
MATIIAADKATLSGRHQLILVIGPTKPQTGTAISMKKHKLTTTLILDPSTGASWSTSIFCKDGALIVRSTLSSQSTSPSISQFWESYKNFTRKVVNLFKSTPQAPNLCSIMVISQSTHGSGTTSGVIMTWRTSLWISISTRPGNKDSKT